MRGMVAQMLQVGSGIGTFGDAAGSAVAVHHIVGYAGGPRHHAPIFLEPALFEWLPGATVFDYWPDSLIWRHPL